MVIRGERRLDVAMKGIQRVENATPMKNPRRIPANTSMGRCPWISLTGLNWYRIRAETLDPSSLRALACWPLERLTPTASRITTRAKQQENTKMSESMPDLKPMAVVTEATSAEWLEGIPPVRQKSNSSRSLKEDTVCVRSVMMVFRNWLSTQLETAARKIGLCTSLMIWLITARFIATIFDNYPLLSRPEVDL